MSFYYIILENILVIKNIIQLIGDIVNIITNIIITIGGIFAIMFFRRLQEKRLDASFSYLSRLKARIHYLLNIFEDYEDEILDRFIPQDKRRPIEASKSLFVNKIIDNFSKYANETLIFLMNADDQFPSGIGWISMYDDFLVFLEDCEKINNEKYYKWASLNGKEDYSSTHKKNMQDMINLINSYQKDIEKKICPKQK